MNKFRIGIDLGGTKIEGVLLEPGGDVLARHRVNTPQSYEGVVAAIATLTNKLNAGQRQALPVGIGTPGSISPLTGRMRNANSTFLNGRPLHEDIAAALGRPVRMANDANCFALSEASDGAGAGASTVFGVIVGTGVGGGVVINGQILEGASGIGGEWGHSPLPWPSPDESPGARCWCGKNGCLETWVSGPAWARWSSNLTGKDQHTTEIAALAAAGNPVTLKSLGLYADRLARGLSTVINLLDPDVIVLGGGVSNVSALYPAVIERLPLYVFSDHIAVRIVPNRHGDSSGVRGAAWLWPLDEAT